MSNPWDERYASGEPLPWDNGAPDRHLVALVDAGRIRKGRALEIGCGTGTNVVELARRGFEVVGLDLAPHAVARARERAREAKVTARFEVHDVLAAPVAGTFDFVFDRGCFHLFDSAAERATFVHRIASALAPGGLWLSLCGSTEGAPREAGPPRRSARDLVDAIEPALRVVELRATEFELSAALPISPEAWLVLSARREQPAQPSTVRSH